MKSYSSLLRIVAVLLNVSLASLLVACGQTGPLYMPTKPVVDTASSTPASNAPGQNAQSPEASAP